MRFTQAEKMEIIKIVQESEIGVNRTLKELGIECDIEKVTNINEIMSFGVMMTPALAVDGEVKVVGKVSSPDEIKAMLE